MVNIVLVEPEIPGNTGNIGRTCVATGSRLHLIKPLGFELSEKQVRRSGLDYWAHLDYHVYENLDEFFLKNFQGDENPNVWLATTKAPKHYAEVSYVGDCYLFFGKESAGLSEGFRMKFPERCVRIPMKSTERSLNLSNAAAILTYEVLRQQNFPDLLGEGEMALLS